MKGLAVTILVCLLIVLPVPALAQEQEGTGFVARVKAFFGVDEPTQATGPAAQEIEASCPFKEHLCAGPQGNVICSGAIDECVQRYGRCACGTGAASAPGQAGEGTTVPVREGQQMRDERAIVNLPEPAQSCSPCRSIVCGSGNDEFLCPSSLDECTGRFGGSCRALRCRDDACPSGTYLCAIEEMVADPPTTVPRQAQVAEENMREGPVVAGGAGVSASRKGMLVHCQGSYEECSTKYGSCSCAGEGEACVFDGRKYAPGQSFPAQDGCNTCTCARDGTVACTLRICEGTCGNGVCEDNERVSCVQVCPDCRPGTPPEQCPCVMRCPQVCPQDCGESDGRVVTGSGTVGAAGTTSTSTKVTTTA